MTGKIRITNFGIRVDKRTMEFQRSAATVITFLTFAYITTFRIYAETQPQEAVGDIEVISQENFEVMPTMAGQCEKYPVTLRGITKIDKYAKPASMNETQSANPELKPGGWWQPSSCRSRQSIAVIVPYRDRMDNLLHFLEYIHPFMQRQQRHYRLYLVEQANDAVYNKGRLLNIGTFEAGKDHDWDCYIFHDVDMLPENDLNIYECGDNPRHFCPAVDERRYTLVHMMAAGAALGMTREQIEKTNGFSNSYWGWGSEDDDMSLRILHSGYKIARPPSHVGRYKMMKHVRQKVGLNRMEHFANWQTRWPSDGMNSLDTLGYRVTHQINHPLYTNISIYPGPYLDDKPKTFIQHTADFVFFVKNL